GTPDIAGAIGLAAAIDYLQALGRESVAAHEAGLLHHATELVQAIPGVRLIGTAFPKAALVSFVVDEPPLSTLDVGMQLDLEGIAVRTGNHCCQRVMDQFGIPGTARASFALYNTVEEIDRFGAVLRKIVGAAATKAKPALGTVNLNVVQAEPAYPPASAPSPA